MAELGFSNYVLNFVPPDISCSLEIANDTIYLRGHDDSCVKILCFSQVIHHAVVNTISDVKGGAGEM